MELNGEVNPVGRRRPSTASARQGRDRARRNGELAACLARLRPDATPVQKLGGHRGRDRQAPREGRQAPALATVVRGRGRPATAHLPRRGGQEQNCWPRLAANPR